MSIQLRTDNNGFLAEIRGSYIDNVKIHDIHTEILKLIEYQKKQISIWKKIIATEKNNPIGNDLRYKVSKLEQGHNQYIADANDLIQRYYMMHHNRDKQRIIDFSSCSTEQDDDCISTEKIYICTEYIELLKPMIDVNVVQSSTYSETDLCLICDDPNFVEIDGVTMCDNCGYVRTVSTDKASMIVSKSNYMDIGNFMKVINKHDGTLRLDDNQMNALMKRLDEYFLSYGKPCGEDVRNMPVNEYGWKNNTSYDLMHEALQYCKMPVYDYVSSICQTYWGYNLPDISSVKKQVMQDYMDSQPVFMDIIKKYPSIRKSSLNTRFRAFKHLQARGANVREEEFRIIKTHDIRVLHDRIWKIMCLRTDIPYIPSI